MAGWGRKLVRAAAAVEQGADGIRRLAGSGRRDGRPLEIVPYAGFGSMSGARLKGRVLRLGAGESPDDPGRPWHNLAASWRRIETDEVAGAVVRATLDDTVYTATTDEEGYFTVELAPVVHAGETLHWVDVPLEVIAPATAAGAQATGRVLLAPPSAQFGVISDIDDTILHTDATRLLRMARHTLFGNARTRLPVPGMPALFAALARGPRGDILRNPIFYVSSSPWNLYQLLVEFFKLQDIPAGPLLLRDWGLDERTDLPTRHHAHKLAAIERVLAECPGLPFLLIGDSGQHDPEIYREVVHRHPRRIPAVYIRRVRRHRQRDAALAALADELVEAGSELVVTNDARGAARHAADRGWIAPEAVARVDAAARRRAARSRA